MIARVVGAVVTHRVRSAVVAAGAALIVGLGIAFALTSGDDPETTGVATGSASGVEAQVTSAQTISSPTPVQAQPTVTPTPAQAQPTVTPTPAQAQPTVTPTPAQAQPTVTPTPAQAQPTVTPTPAQAQPTGTPSPSPTPTPPPVSELERVVTATLASPTTFNVGFTNGTCAQPSYNQNATLQLVGSSLVWQQAQHNNSGSISFPSGFWQVETPGSEKYEATMFLLPDDRLGFSGVYTWIAGGPNCTWDVSGTQGG